MLSKELRRYRRRAVLAGLLGGVLAAGLAYQAGAAATVLTLVFLLAAGVLAVPLALTGIVLDRLRRVEGDIRALVNLRPLCGTWPVSFEDPAIDPHLAELAARLVASERPRLILECGSGSSTVILAACLRELGSGRLVSLEHDAGYAERTRAWLRLVGLEDWASVVTAPLQQRQVGETTMLWYGPGYEDELHEGVDLLLVDGPPRRVAKLARYPAVPLLRAHLSPSCVVLADDGDRRESRRMAQDWAVMLGGSAEYCWTRKGAWLLRPAGGPAASQGTR